MVMNANNELFNRHAPHVFVDDTVSCMVRSKLIRHDSWLELLNEKSEREYITIEAGTAEDQPATEQARQSVNLELGMP